MVKVMKTSAFFKVEASVIAAVINKFKRLSIHDQILPDFQIYFSKKL